MADGDPEPDPRIVFVAEDARLAEAVINLLAANNIEAELAAAGPQTAGGLFGTTETVPTEEFPILVSDPAKAKDARELLATAEQVAAVRSIRDKRASRTGTVAVVCEDCGKSSDWPATAMGTTETCPHCSGYMDIPDPDEDWSGVDFGEAEDDAKEE